MDKLKKANSRGSRVSQKQKSYRFEVQCSVVYHKKREAFFGKSLWFAYAFILMITSGLLSLIIHIIFEYFGFAEIQKVLEISYRIISVQASIGLCLYLAKQENKNSRLKDEYEKLNTILLNKLSQEIFEEKIELGKGLGRQASPRYDTLYKISCNECMKTTPNFSDGGLKDIPRWRRIFAQVIK